jgi:hypothetical protein
MVLVVFGNVLWLCMLDHAMQLAMEGRLAKKRAMLQAAMNNYNVQQVQSIAYGTARRNKPHMLVNL